jgi:glutamine---fructose-6-phosphate transaminase (isomerizing)
VAAAVTAPTTDSAMYQTMHRQPDDVRRLLDTGWPAAQEAAQRLSGAARVFTVGIGTSYHAALVGAWLLRAAGTDARAVSSFDFGLYPESADLQPQDAVVVMAHSGVKTYSTDALARAVAAGATRISVGSLTAVHEGSQQVLRTVEREKSAAFTASHLAAMTVLAQVATALGENRGTAATRSFRSALEQVPVQVADVLRREDEVVPIAQLAATRRVYAAGAGPNEATALEAVIKVREAAQGWIDGLAIEQFLHGPLVAVNADDLAVVVNVPGRSVERVHEIARVLAAIGARVWLIGQGVEGLASAVAFALTEVPELLSPLLAVVPVQILAYQMAVVRGINPDLFRRDDARYAAALGLLKL